MKINKAKIRRESSQKIVDKFIEDKLKYECMADVFALRSFALGIAKELLDQGINLSKSNYPFAFAGLMADMFLWDAAKIVKDLTITKEHIKIA